MQGFTLRCGHGADLGQSPDCSLARQLGKDDQLHVRGVVIRRGTEFERDGAAIEILQLANMLQRAGDADVIEMFATIFARLDLCGC